MFKRILSALLVAALVVVVSSVVVNAVTGKFTTLISLHPTTTAAQKVVFETDLEFLLDIKFTVSGLTFSHQLAMGVAGVEHSVFDLEATLGALTIRDTFVFARPFSDGDVPPPPGAVCPAVPLPTGAIATGIVPGRPDICPAGPPLFVKKRVLATISLGGITFTTMALFEDVNFSAPLGGFGRFLVEVGQGVPRPAADLDGNNIYNVLDQRFRFGTVLIVSGETPTGIVVTSKTTLNTADLWNCVKKKCWFQTVIEQPVDPAVPPPIAEELRHKLYFFKETISIENIRIGPVTFDIWMEFRPTGGVPPAPLFYWDVEARFALPPLGTVTVIYGNLNAILDPLGIGLLDPVTAYSPVFLDMFPYFGQLLRIPTPMGYIDITYDSALEVAGIRAVNTLKLDPAPATVAVVVNVIPPTGLGSYVVRLVIDLGGGMSLVFLNCFGVNLRFTQFLSLCDWTVTPPPRWAFSRITLTTVAGPIGIVGDAFITPIGLQEAKVRLTIKF